MGYCGRCGDVVPGELARCRCGGTARAAKSSSVLSDGRPVTPEGARGDAWSRRYVQRSPGSASKKSSANTVLRHDTNEPAFSEPASTSARPPPPTRKHSKHLKLPHMSPSLEDVEETITRAFGSVLDPQSQRAKWACAACNTMFVRDQTVYPDPRSKQDPALADTLYCPSCFADRFSLGKCFTCGTTVLPDAACPFIQRKDKLWHAACYACLYCSEDLSKNPQVDLYGNPCCAACFDSAAFLKSPTIERVPALLSADNAGSSKPSAAEQAKLKRQEKLLGPAAVKLGPAVNELRGRLEKAGFDDKSKNHAGSAALSPPLSPRKQLPSPSLGSASRWKLPSAQPEVPTAIRAPPIEKPAPPSDATAPMKRHVRAAPSVEALRQKFTSPASLVEKPVTSPPITQAPFGKLASAPPMSRSLSDNPASLPKPSPAPAQWQRHRLTRSVAALPLTGPPAIFSEQVKTLAAPAQLPTSPVLAQIARFEGASQTSASSAHHWQRPQRNGRSQSMFAVPTLSELKQQQPSPAVSQQEPVQARIHASERQHIEPKVDSRRISPKLPIEALQTGVPSKAGASIAQASPSSPIKDVNASASAAVSADSRCSGCQLRLFRIGDSSQQQGKIITLPDSGTLYHARCFVCSECKKAFESGAFVELDNGKRVHETCAPQVAFTSSGAQFSLAPGVKPEPSRPSSEQQQPVFRASPSITALQKQQSAVQVTPLSPSKIQIKVKPQVGPTKLSKASEVFAGGRVSSAAQNLGGMYTCAGCSGTATMAETTLGPVGTRFHHRCLVCSCGKKLDSNARSLEVPDGCGEVRRRFACRDCIDKDRLAKRSLSSGTALSGGKGRI